MATPRAVVTRRRTPDAPADPGDPLVVLLHGFPEIGKTPYEQLVVLDEFYGVIRTSRTQSGGWR